MPVLDGLSARIRYTAHMGALEGCLAYLGVPITPAWLYGGTAHALVINVTDTLCPSGPTAWNTGILHRLAPNLGYTTRGISVWRQEAGEAFRARQQEAWDLVRASIDRGLPCYGWQLEAPNYFVINGYDDVGYYYSGDDDERTRGPLPWERLATWDVELLEVYVVEPCAPAVPDVAVREAVVAALRHAEAPPEWVYPGYHAGPRAFEVWASAVQEGHAGYDGHCYNAQVWHECRAMAADFLQQAQTRLPGRCQAPLTEAAGHYGAVRDRLGAVLAMHPPRSPEDWTTPLQSAGAAALLAEAARAERAALGSLEQLLRAL